MAGPLAGISAAEIAKQKLADQSVQQPKQGPSKFDQALKAREAQAPAQVEKVSAPHATQQVQKARQIEQVAKAEKAQLNKATGVATGEPLGPRAADPVAQKAEVQKSTSMMAHMIADMEKGQSVIDKLIKAGISGKNFNNGELLALQAGMYKYVQELELTGKVVEKATTGLKDTLKTQV